MKTFEECRPCFLRQGLRAAAMGGASPAQTAEVERRVREYASSMDIHSGSPAKLASGTYRIVREVLGVHDPYERIKRESNQHALEMYDRVSVLAPVGMDPLEQAVHLSLVGNIIDFGTEITIDLEGTARRGFAAPFAIDEMDYLLEKIGPAKKVLYLTDNAGEIVFDRGLLRLLGQERREVVIAVKGGPVINDATLGDAEEVGLSSFGRVIENGTDSVGTQLEDCSPEFLREWESADLIISKGQANAESLLGLSDERIFFLFLVKCGVMAEFLGLDHLDFIAASAPTLLGASSKGAKKDALDVSLQTV